jgi:hypothetical protein
VQQTPEQRRWQGAILGLGEQDGVHPSEWFGIRVGGRWCLFLLRQSRRRSRRSRMPLGTHLLGDSPPLPFLIGHRLLMLYNNQPSTLGSSSPSQPHTYRSFDATMRLLWQSPC